MSMKENIDYIKDEIGSEERMLQNFIKVEKFYKKYKIAIIALVIASVAWAITYSVTSYLDEKKLLESNELFNKVIEDRNDTASIKKLEELDSNLAQVIKFMKDAKSAKGIDVEPFKSIAMLNEAVNSNDIKKVEALASNPNFILREYAIFYQALLLTKSKEFKKAKNILQTIPKDSSFSEYVNKLNHYLLTK
jgi:hypothetical protein